MGLEAIVTVDNPCSCPVAEASTAVDAPVSSVARCDVGDGTVVEEFELGAAADPPPGTREVFVDNHHGVYRFERNADQDCVCDCIESFGTPVTDVSAVDGRLRVIFRPDDGESLRRTIETLRDQFGGITLEHLVQSGDSRGGDTVFVDRDRLTDRQREVLETAYEMGYFEHPKGANGQDVAAALDVSSATFRGHLAAAQSKLLAQILDE